MVWNTGFIKKPNAFKITMKCYPIKLICDGVNVVDEI